MSMTIELKRIALVEDDPDIAVLAAMTLEDFGGFAVVHFSSGEAALEGLAAAAPDLAILDYSMPGMNGDTLLSAMRASKHLAAIPVVFMTASVMPAHVTRLKALGAIEVIKKPFDPLRLSEQIREIWGRL
jgi:CheY-like chemotaxis protein